MIMLISNVPKPADGAEHGLDAAGLMHLYSKEWRVEAMFRTHKRPMIVERLFIKDPGRADALVNVVNMAALLRAVMQVVMRRTLDGLDDDELPLLGRSNGKVQRNITVDYFVEQCANCMLYYDSGSGTYGLMNSRGQERAEGFLNLFGMGPDDLFRRS